MTALLPKSPVGHAALLALLMAATVGTALGFEHIGGFIPCKLCLEQRIPYYVGAPFMLAAFLAGRFGAPGALVRGALVVGGLLMLWGLGLGIYHSGVEWHWWAGPADCSGSATVITTDVNDLLGSLGKKPPACDQAAGRFLGLSFAGWNVLASLALAAAAFRGARMNPDRQH